MPCFLKNTNVIVIFLARMHMNVGSHNMQIYLKYTHRHLDKGIGDQGQVQMVSCCCDANSGKEGAARLMCRQN